MSRLTLKFAVASLVPILVLGWLLSTASRHQIEHRSTQLYGKTTGSIVRLGGTVLFRAEDFAPGVRMDAQRERQTRTFLENLSVQSSQVRMIAVAPDGRVIFANYVGAPATVPTSGAIAAALAGTTSTDIVHGDKSYTYPLWKGRLVEAEVPIRFGGVRSAPAGVIVVSGLDSVFISQVDADVAHLRRLLAGGLAALWLVLVPIVLSTSRRLRNQAQENEHLAHHDTLTGLPNRTRLDGRLRDAIVGADRDGSLVGLLLIDLDGFKDVNDTLGHRAGDDLLRHVARRLTAGTRAEDVVARLGGDEFAIVVHDVVAREDLVDVLDRITGALLEPMVIDGVDIAVEASIGVALYPLDAGSAEALLQHADIAMYAAKDTGAQFSFYSVDLDSHTPSRLGLAAELRRALADEDEQVVVHFQPVATAAGRVVSMEALVRWHHPTLGLLEPDSFIPLAEQSGLIHRLTRHVLGLAAEQGAAWHHAGLDVAVSVNLSARDLRDGTIVDEVRGVLVEHDLPPANLELEVTETAVLASPDRAVHLVNQLRDMGVGIALDDFGTGFSSLTNLKRLRPHRLKIDRGFVSSMADDAVDAAIVQSVVQLARSLEIGVTAEGVETQAQWDLLEGLGCDLLQGLLLSPPMPGPVATAWLGARAETPA
ncbi:MAG: diguanylate cyclase domain protein [Actinomycetia bacterium]|nr:diguanylate cyclase domain protein [Actinomycetes bacterium]